MMGLAESSWSSGHLYFVWKIGVHDDHGGDTDDDNGNNDDYDDDDNKDDDDDDGNNDDDDDVIGRMMSVPCMVVLTE